MGKALKQNQILFTIIQLLKKMKYKHSFSKKVGVNINLLFFFWENNWIYGFIKYKTQRILIFFKSNLLGFSYNTKKIYKIYTHKQFKKEYLWIKNTFFIIKKTKDSFLNIHEVLSFKIGGFVLVKLF